MSEQESSCELPPEVRALFPFTSRYFTVGKNRLHYVDEGQGPVLLLMHACPLWSFSFRDVIRTFSSSYRVVALDQMGFGLSDKPADFDYRLEMHADLLEMFVHSLKLTDITLVMHGRGSTIGMAYAVRNPDNIRAFVTLNAMGFTGFLLPWRLQICRVPWLGAKIVLGLDLLTREFRRYPEAIRTAYSLPFPDRESKVSLVRFIEDIPCVPEDDSAQSMLEVETSLWMLRGKPASIIWARRDWLYTKSSFRSWTKYFPEAEVHWIENAGRYIPEDAPDELLAILRDFLEKTRC